MTALATEKQVRFINSLTTDRVIPVGAEGLDPETFTKIQASRFIDMMKAQPRKVTEVSTSSREDLEGMHRFGGVIFKVQRAIHGSGNLYAKALVEDSSSESGWVFEYAPGAIRNLTDQTRLSLEDAKKFGALYGTCCVCGRTLTNETSIAEGIGPVCSKKF